MNEKKRCEFVSPRGQIRCQLDRGHSGRHRAWNDEGIPTLAMGDGDAIVTHSSQAGLASIRGGIGRNLIRYCAHDLSLTGAEGPIRLLGRWPVLWSCDECGATVSDT